MSFAISSNPTNGWDTVYAIRYADVNAAILKAWADPQAKLPREFNWSGDVSGTQITLQGKWQPWQLTTGGGGGNIVMILPLDQIQSTPHRPLGISFPSAIRAKVTVQAAFVSTGGTQQNLVTNASSDHVTVDSVTTAEGNAVEFLAGTVMNEALAAWLTENLGQFGFVFHTVDFAGKLAGDATTVTPGLAWLLPTTVNYGVYEPPVVNGIASATLQNSIFGVLAMTEKRTNPTPTNSVDPAAIPAGDRSGLLISAERFLEKFIQPTLPTLFNGATAGQFSFDNDGNLTNSTALTFNQMTITDPDGSNSRVVTPDIKAQGFTIGVEGAELSMRMNDFHWIWSSGLDVFTDYATWVSLSLQSGAFTWATDRTDPPEATIVKSEAIQIEEIVIPIAVAVAGAIIGVAAPAFLAKVAASTTVEATAEGASIAMEDLGQTTGQVAGQAAQEVAQEAASGTSTLGGCLTRTWVKVLCGVIGAGVGAGLGAVPDILNLLAENQKNKVPQLQPFLTNLSLAMQWPNADKPLITSAQLANALQIGLNPGFQT